MPPSTNTMLVEQFRQVLLDSEQLFRQCAQDCLASQPPSSQTNVGRFLSWMDELHKSLLIKVYVFIAEADERWSAEEKQLAEVLFEYIWPCGDHRQNLRDAAGRVFAVANGLQWNKLFRPFDEYPILRERVADIESVIVRMANLVAKCDGQVSPPEVARLRQLQIEIDKHLKRICLEALTPEMLIVPATSRHQRQSEPLPKKQEKTPELKLASVVPPPQRSAEERLADELSKLDRLIGLETIKHEVRTLVNFLKLQSERSRAGLPNTNLSLHMVFAGNPGTGKTTVGRIIGAILGAMGILSKGHLIEVDRSGLVAEYAGQTAVKTNKKIDEALDGVLFVDEAYSLNAEGNDDPYGNEAVQALLKRLEDERKRLVVILAGYSGPMDRLLRSNPGLSSRFNTKLVFDDYAPAEMGRIFQGMGDEHHYRVAGTVQAKVLVAFKQLYDRRDEHFGNARLVRNTFETAVRRLANRIASIVPLTTELLTDFAPEDVVVEGFSADELQGDKLERWRFQIICESCKAENLAVANVLGRRVKCTRCQHEFLAAWGEPIHKSAK